MFVALVGGWMPRHPMSALFHPTIDHERRNRRFDRFYLASVVIVQQTVAFGGPLADIDALSNPFRRGIMPDQPSLGSQEREQGRQFAPRFDSAGLITTVVVDQESRDVLVVAFMNAHALEKTRST